MKTCFLLKPIQVAVVYVTMPQDSKHVQLAMRFVESYQRHPPLHPHETIIVCNGSPPSTLTRNLFKHLPSVRFLEHDDSGWDIGAYQKAAREVPCDLIVFFGCWVHFPRPGWLGRMCDAYAAHGWALYGTMGNRGAGGVQPHIRTTGFFMPPELLNAYPIQVTRPDQRYEFEHGQTCLTGWVTRQGFKSLVVTWDGVYEWKDWDNAPNGYHRGDQSGVLIRERLTDPPYYQ